MKRYTLTVEEWLDPINPAQDHGMVTAEISTAMTRAWAYGANPDYPLEALRGDSVLEASHWAESNLPVTPPRPGPDTSRHYCGHLSGVPCGPTVRDCAHPTCSLKGEHRGPCPTAEEAIEHAIGCAILAGLVGMEYRP